MAIILTIRLRRLTGRSARVAEWNILMWRWLAAYRIKKSLKWWSCMRWDTTGFMEFWAATSAILVGWTKGWTLWMRCDMWRRSIQRIRVWVIWWRVLRRNWDYWVCRTKTKAIWCIDAWLRLAWINRYKRCRRISLQPITAGWCIKKRDWYFIIWRPIWAILCLMFACKRILSDGSLGIRSLRIFGRFWKKRADRIWVGCSMIWLSQERLQIIKLRG